MCNDLNFLKVNIYFEMSLNIYSFIFHLFIFSNYFIVRIMVEMVEMVGSVQIATTCFVEVLAHCNDAL